MPRKTVFLSSIIPWLAVLALCVFASGVASGAEGDVTEAKALGSFTVSQGHVIPTMATPPHVYPAKKPHVVKPYSAGPLYDISPASKKTRKLWRGIHNVAFGWVEIPKKVIVDIVETDPFTGFFTGVGRGGKLAVRRTGIGFAETFTFWAAGKRAYRPIVEPEFVMGDMLD